MTLIEKARQNRLSALALISADIDNIFVEQRHPRRPRPSTLPNFLKRGIDGADARAIRTKVRPAAQDANSAPAWAAYAPVGAAGGVQHAA